MERGNKKTNELNYTTTCYVCGRPHKYSSNGYAHPSKCWICAPSGLPLKYGVRSFNVKYPRKTRKH